MKKITAEASVESSSDPEAIFSLLANSATFPFWSMIDEFEMVRPGKDGPYGLESQRIFRTGRFTMLEEVVEIVPNRRVAYVLLSGFPMDEYRAETVLEPLGGGGTRIVWRCSFLPRYRATGWFWRRMMTSVFKRLTHGLALASEDRARLAEFLAAGHGTSTSKRSLASRTHARTDPTFGLPSDS